MNIYDSRLRVKPFITAPLGDRQQSFLLVHSDFSRDWEIFANRAHAYVSSIHPTLPVACQVYRYGSHILISMTVESEANELASNRSGSYICLGALIHVDAFALPEVTVRTFLAFAKCIAAATGLNLDRDGLTTWSLMLQSDPIDPLSSDVVTAILATFEREFGVVPRRRNPWRVLKCIVRAVRLLWQASDIVTAVNVGDALHYWRSILPVPARHQRRGTSRVRVADAAWSALPLVFPAMSVMAWVAARRILSFGAASPGFVLSLVALAALSATTLGLSVSFAHNASQVLPASATAPIRTRIASGSAATCAAIFAAHLVNCVWLLR